MQVLKQSSDEMGICAARVYMWAGLGWRLTDDSIRYHQSHGPPDIDGGRYLPVGPPPS
jgi:hypothetical protein